MLILKSDYLLCLNYLTKPNVSTTAYIRCHIASLVYYYYSDYRIMLDFVRIGNTRLAWKVVFGSTLFMSIVSTKYFRTLVFYCGFLLMYNLGKQQGLLS